MVLKERYNQITITYEISKRENIEKIMPRRGTIYGESMDPKYSKIHTTSWSFSPGLNRKEASGLILKLIHNKAVGFNLRDLSVYRNSIEETK